MHSCMNPQDARPSQSMPFRPAIESKSLVNECVDSVKLGERAVHTFDRVGQPIHEVA